MTERKSRYREFCQNSYVPLHQQPWWLDAVCHPEGWDVALAFDGSGAVTGALPWFRKSRWGLWVVQQPPFTTYAGPVLRYPDEPNFKLQSRYSFEKKVCSALIQQLPRVAFFVQNFQPEISNWLPFYWENFKQTTRYTYVFDRMENMEMITAGMKNTLRSDLKKAAKATVWQQENDAWELVFALYNKSWQRKKASQPYSFDTFLRLHEALAARGQMICFIARDRSNGTPHAGLYAVFDERQASVLLTGVEPEYKSSCAIYGLFVEMIRWCGERNLSLDFEGSMQPEIEHVFRAFGARQQPYFQVWKARNRLLELIFHLTH